MLLRMMAITPSGSADQLRGAVHANDHAPAKEAVMFNPQQIGRHVRIVDILSEPEKKVAR